MIDAPLYWVRLDSADNLEVLFDTTLPIVVVPPRPRSARYHHRWRTHVGIPPDWNLHGWHADALLDATHGVVTPVTASDSPPADPLRGRRPAGFWWVTLDHGVESQSSLIGAIRDAISDAMDLASAEQDLRDGHDPAGPLAYSPFHD